MKLHKSLAFILLATFAVCSLHGNAEANHIAPLHQKPFDLVQAQELLFHKAETPLSLLSPLLPSRSWTMKDSSVSPQEQGTAASHEPNRAFEINRPTRVLPDEENLKGCTTKLLEHSFANSYGHPYVMQYSPDLIEEEWCKDPEKWVFIQLDIYGRGKGRQFDRLGSVQLDGVEVLRTDNQEPNTNGTFWSFSKEVNKYYDLFKQQRSLVFDFPNIVNDVYVSPLNMTLSLTVYVAIEEGCQRQPLSLDYATILPLSKRNFTENSFFEIGEGFQKQGHTSIVMPQNARSAIVEIYASGTAQDEFWYTNLPDEVYEEAGGAAANIAYPRGPLRELQLRIDGQLAGVAQPYPVVFTGGISPLLWRPEVAFGAFDQPTYLMDITPFLGSLTDGEAHDFALTVVSAEKNQTVLGWFVSGNVQVQLDSSQERTTGAITLLDAPVAGHYQQHGYVTGNVSTNGSVYAEIRTAQPRVVRIEGTVKPGSSKKAYPVRVSHTIEYSNVNDANTSNSTTVQTAKTQMVSYHDNELFISSTSDYPFTLKSIGYDTTLEHGYHSVLRLCRNAASTFKEPLNSKVDMTQDARAHTIIEGNPPSVVGGFGETMESYNYEDSDELTYTQDTTVANQTVTHNEVRGSLSSKAVKVN
jgi:hypothetical protein